VQGEEGTVERYIVGEIPRTLLIDSNGGSVPFADAIAEGNRLLSESGGSVTAFLRSNVRSAAFRICRSIPVPWRTTARTEFLWHYMRYRHRTGMDLIKHASSKADEGRANAEGSEAFEEYLRSRVTKEKVDSAIGAFRKAKRYDEQMFRMTGKTAAEWGLAELLDDQSRPSDVFQKQTGIEVPSLPNDNLIRKFLESFDSDVDRETLIRPCF
jgi:hypothetical protein